MNLLVDRHIPAVAGVRIVFMRPRRRNLICHGRDGMFLVCDDHACVLRRKSSVWKRRSEEEEVEEKDRACTYVRARDDYPGLRIGEMAALDPKYVYVGRTGKFSRLCRIPRRGRDAGKVIGSVPFFRQSPI